MARVFDSIVPQERFSVKNRFNLEDNQQIKGYLELVVTYTDGSVDVIDLGENVITTAGRSNMAHILAGDDSANRVVSTVKFGDGGHNPSSPTTALPPAPSDTDLFGNMVIEKVVSYSFPDGNAGTKVMFSATIGTEEGNGSGAQAYSECGLYDVQDRILTHKTFGLITKSNAFSLTLQYTIQF